DPWGFGPPVALLAIVARGSDAHEHRVATTERHALRAVIPAGRQVGHDGLFLALGLELARREPPAKDAILHGEIEEPAVHLDVVPPTRAETLPLVRLPVAVAVAIGPYAAAEAVA